MTTNDVAKLLKLNKDMYQHSDRPFTDDTLGRHWHIYHSK